jgi:hypothetical protein
MNRISFAFLLVLAVGAASFAQTSDQSALLCNLPREKAPVVRGIRLGMTADEIHSRLPIRADYQEFLAQAQKFPAFGDSSLSANPRETDKGQPFEGIEWFNFQLFDGHVVSYTARYKGPDTNPRGPTWAHADDFIARFAEAYHLPGAANWISSGAYRLLRCKGFDVRASHQDGAQVIVTEAGGAWVAEQKKRRETYEEQLRHDFKP